MYNYLIALVDESGNKIYEEFFSLENIRFSKYYDARGAGAYNYNIGKQTEVKKFLENDSQPLLIKLNTPIFIYQGSNDDTVPKQVTDILVQAAKAKGTNINYVTDSDNSIDPKWNHGTVYTDNWDEIVLDVKSFMPIQ